MVWRRERGGCGASGLLSVAKPATTRVAWVRATVGIGRAFAEGSSDASRDAGEGEGEAAQGVEGAWTAARERGRGRGPLSASGAGGDAKGGGGGDLDLDLEGEVAPCSLSAQKLTHQCQNDALSQREGGEDCPFWFGWLGTCTLRPSNTPDTPHSPNSHRGVRLTTLMHVTRPYKAVKVGGGGGAALAPSLVNVFTRAPPPGPSRVGRRALWAAQQRPSAPGVGPPERGLGTKRLVPVSECSCVFSHSARLDSWHTNRIIGRLLRRRRAGRWRWRLSEQLR